MTTIRSWWAAAGLGLALLAGTGAAHARSDVYWSVGVGVPGVVVGAGNAAPVYYTPPAPVYYAPPPPVYYAPPPPVYQSPRPVYYAPPVMVAPRPYWRGHGYHGHHGGRRDWR
ncbi:hypothetical protein [Pulveribacter suum]|uniref:Glutelin n=1 Tax=Pulveribacter suum TaxID=2116657 RepID=A0A2P1NM10_9BURK|nr:hypothetical protein [Pulveribacter suum]AVP58093.1 hypothetical protein C7H73_10740 [Pulveribacter suum]